MAATAHRGNKAFLPSKPCAHCARPMTWRKRWARTWDDVRYCSDGCRVAAARARRPAEPR
ncbi:MAG: DUF2256 domain-containing protein [Burkholderiaceae bacterium]|nr:DUF2256 domain-containing protein [Burkholderiales bacterium]MCZ8098478.1 DUF2256 domain-containing protein [Burkholderiales bacterium]MCZ8340083.1 DUF2256 domain-containing protein [Burkholderiaceae bacterium]